MAETGTALSVVEEQQSVVGNALVGASGSAVLAENSDSSVQILEQIRDIQVKTLRGISDIAKGISDMFALEKLQDRRLKEDETEANKEKLDPDEGKTDDLPKVVSNEEGGGGGKGIFGAILASVGGLAFFKKLMAPFIAIFGKSGMLVKLFGRFGPLGALILGFTLVYKYSDEIAAALAPAIDKIKEIIVKLKPLIDFLKRVGDFLIKQLLEGVGGALTLVVTAVEGVIDGFKMIFEGDVMGGLNRMFGLKDGLLGFLLDLPKKIFDGAKKFLGGLADAMGIDFKKLYDSIVQYVNDTITNIKNFFIDLATNISKFFTDAYNTAKTTITDAVNGAFTFIGNIFTTIGNFFTDSFNMIKDFVTGLPSRILGFVRSMFSPITDFFLNIGNTIKGAVNGVIEALPLPEFVKKKIKFNIEPTEAELKEAEALTGDAKVAEKIASDEREGIEKIGGDNIFKDGVLQSGGKNLETAMLGRAEAIAEGIGDQVKVAMNKKTGKYVIVKQDMNLAEREGTVTQSPDLDMSDVIGEGGLDTSLRVPSTSIPDLATDDQGAITVVNNNYNTNNSSVANQTDVHSGSLDTGIDSYHDKLATASA